MSPPSPINRNQTHYRWVRRLLFALMAWFLVAWPIGAAVDLDYLLNNELGFLVVDFLLIIPLILTTQWGLRQGKPWAPLLVMVVIGAYAVDSTLYFIFLGRNELFGVPGFIYFSLIPIMLSILLWLLRRHLAVLLPGES